MIDYIPIIGSNVFLIAIIGLVTIHSWLPSIRPDWYYIFNIYEHNLLNYRQHKIFLPIAGTHDDYSMKGCTYDKKDHKPHINSQGVYEWNFINGLKDPVEFVNPNNPSDGLLVDTVKKQGAKIIDDIVAGQPTFEDFLKTYGVLIVGLIIVIFMIYMGVKQDENFKVLLNVTLSRG